MGDTKKSPHRGRPRGFQTEAAIAAAEAVFHARGYDATSVADLGSAMGLNPPSLYAAFGSKRGLFQRAVERYAAGMGSDLHRTLDGEGTAAERIARFLAHAAGQYAAAGNGCLVLAALDSSTDAEACAIAAAEVARGHEAIAGVISAERPGDTELADAIAEDVTIALAGLSAAARRGAEVGALAHAAETFAAGIAARLEERS